MGFNGLRNGILRAKKRKQNAADMGGLLHSAFDMSFCLFLTESYLFLTESCLFPDGIMSFPDGRCDLQYSFGSGLHALRHFDSEESHTVLEGLCHVLGDDEACKLLVLGVSTEDAVIVIELVELLGQLVAVVCYA